MSRPIDLRDYVPVRDRVRAFYARFPRGSIRTELAVLEEDLVVFRAAVHRDAADPHPTTGWAYERPGGGTEPDRRLAVESCECAAVGRALANLGLAGARRPSREEMAKVQRMGRMQRTGREPGARKVG